MRVATLLLLAVIVVPLFGCSQAQTQKSGARDPSAKASPPAHYSLPAGRPTAPRPALVSVSAAQTRLAFRRMTPRDSVSRRFVGARVLGSEEATVDRALELDYEGDLTVFERPFATRGEAEDALAGVLDGGFRPGFMKRVDVNGQQAIGWNPVDDRRPGGVTIPYSGLAWLGADGTMLYTVFGSDSLSLDQLTQIARSMTPEDAQ